MSGDGTSPPAGWYTDPNDPTRERYWEGAVWTTETRGPAAPTPTPPPIPAQEVPPPWAAEVVSQEAAIASAEGPSERPWWKRKRYIIPGASIAALLAIGPFVDSSDDPSQTSSADSTTTSLDVDQEPTTTTEVAEELPESTTTQLNGEESQATAIVTTGMVALANQAIADAPTSESLTAQTPYDRDLYDGGGWGDLDNDCQSDRHEVLIEESLVEVELSDDGCQVVTGLWIDLYDGAQYTSAGDVTVDHVVPLAAAHRAGAWAWDEESKRAFSSDIGFPPSLAIVGGDTNQAKADLEPDKWRPQESAWCQYALDWVAVKTRWGLAFSISEGSALLEMLATCQPVNSDATQTLEIPDAIPLANPTTSTTTTPPESSTTTVSTAVGPAVVVVASCNAQAETVVLRNDGGTQITLTGWILHDRGNNHSTGQLGSVTLAPGQQVTMLSGEDSPEQDGAIRWTNNNVWNNDGDTATLLDASGNEISTRPC
jgi:hypothetical protein